MPPIQELIQQGTTNLWVFIPTAVLLGALHGLEPGHSKTMMASFIIAVRGTIGQAALLGLCAALSHSLVVWALAAAALKFGNELIAEQSEPYFMLLSALVVIGVSIWMLVRTRRDELAANAHQHAPHAGKIINTGHGIVELEVFESGFASTLMTIRWLPRVSATTIRCPLKPSAPTAPSRPLNSRHPECSWSPFRRFLNHTNSRLF
jgi:nickel/cobalt exporter